MSTWWLSSNISLMWLLWIWRDCENYDDNFNEWQQQCIWCKSNEQNVMNMMATVTNTMAIVIDSMTNVMNAMAIKMNTMATIIVITLLWASACMKMNSHFLKMANFGLQQIYNKYTTCITSYKSKTILLTFSGYYFPTRLVWELIYNNCEICDMFLEIKMSQHVIKMSWFIKEMSWYVKKFHDMS